MNAITDGAPYGLSVGSGSQPTVIQDRHGQVLCKCHDYTNAVGICQTLNAHAELVSRVDIMERRLLAYRTLETRDD